MTVKYIPLDGVRLEHSRSMRLKSLRDLLRGTTHARKQLSPITLATSEVAIYFYTYVDYAIVHSYVTSQANHVFLQNKGHLLYEICSRMGQCHNLHHRNPFDDKLFFFHSYPIPENISSVLSDTKENT